MLLPAIAILDPTLPMILAVMGVLIIEFIVLRIVRANLGEGSFVLLGTVLLILNVMSLYKGVGGSATTGIPEEVFTLPVADGNEIHSSVPRAPQDPEDDVIHNCLVEGGNTDKDTLMPLIIAYAPEGPTRLTFHFEQINTVNAHWKVADAGIMAEGALNGRYGADYDSIRTSPWGGQIEVTKIGSVDPSFQVALPITDAQKYQEMTVTAKIIVLYPTWGDIQGFFSDESRELGIRCKFFIVPQKDLGVRAADGTTVFGWIWIVCMALVGIGLIICGGILSARRQKKSNQETSITSTE